MRKIVVLLALLGATPALAQSGPTGSFTSFPLANSLSGSEVMLLDQTNGSGGYTTSQTTVSALLRVIQAPGVSQRGGVFAAQAGTNQFVTGINTNGNLTFGQPTCSALSNSATSCSTDATNATNITSGTLAVGRLPALTGVVTMSAGTGVTTIPNGSITGAMLAAGAAGSGSVTSVTCGPGLSGGSFTTSGTCSLTAPVTVANGGTGVTVASPTALDNITGWAITGLVNRTGAGTYVGVSLPLSVSNGGTGASAAGATAAGNIGALAASNNLSDLSNAAAARTALGLGSVAQLSSIAFANIASGAIATSANWLGNASNVVNTPNAIWGAAAPANLTYGATITPDFSQGVNYAVTLTGAATLGAPSNVKAGQTGAIRVAQDATGSRTLAYNTLYKWVGGNACTLTTTANAVDYLFYFAYSSSEIMLSCALNVK